MSGTLVRWSVSTWPTSRAKIKVSGRLSGKWRSREPIWRSWALVSARVLAGQKIYLGLQNCTAIHGKEKVYGSIP